VVELNGGFSKEFSTGFKVRDISDVIAAGPGEYEERLSQARPSPTLSATEKQIAELFEACNRLESATLELLSREVKAEPGMVPWSGMDRLLDINEALLHATERVDAIARMLAERA